MARTGKINPMQSYIIHTDGACHGNPGPGGYAALIKQGGQRREISGGYRLTTNNRMELLAAITALESLPSPATVTLFSDSRYLVDAVNQGWLESWHAKGWKRGTRPIPNADLWKRLMTQNSRHKVTYRWVEGHAGDPDNERCDRLAVQAASRKDLPPDPGYTPNAPAPQPSLF